MNKDLNGNIYRLEPIVLQGIRNALARYPNSDGKERAYELLKGSVNYNQLKTILHDIKTYKANGEMEKYELCGGSDFERWGTTILNNDRINIKRNKESSKNADSIGGIQGRTNPSLKKHTKNETATKPARTNMKPNSVSNTASTLKLGKLFEEIIKLNT